MIMVRRSLLPISLFLIGLTTVAQQTQRTAYAITGGQKGQFNWTEVKLIDLNTGDVLQSIYENGKSIPVINARTGKPITISPDKQSTTENNQLPFSTFSAACAYDKNTTGFTIHRWELTNSGTSISIPKKQGYFILRAKHLERSPVCRMKLTT
jgi:hypothetical protein